MGLLIPTSPTITSPIHRCLLSTKNNPIKISVSDLISADSSLSHLLHPSQRAPAARAMVRERLGVCECLPESGGVVDAVWSLQVGGWWFSRVWIAIGSLEVFILTFFLFRLHCSLFYFIIQDTTNLTFPIFYF